MYLRVLSERMALAVCHRNFCCARLSPARMDCVALQSVLFQCTDKCCNLLCFLASTFHQKLYNIQFTGRSSSATNISVSEMSPYLFRYS